MQFSVYWNLSFIIIVIYSRKRNMTQQEKLAIYAIEKLIPIFFKNNGNLSFGTLYGYILRSKEKVKEIIDETADAKKILEAKKILNGLELATMKIRDAEKIEFEISEALWKGINELVEKINDELGINLADVVDEHYEAMEAVVDFNNFEEKVEKSKRFNKEWEDA